MSPIFGVLCVDKIEPDHAKYSRMRRDRFQLMKYTLAKSHFLKSHILPFIPLPQATKILFILIISRQNLGMLLS